MYDVPPSLAGIIIANVPASVAFFMSASSCSMVVGASVMPSDFATFLFQYRPVIDTPSGTA